MTYIYNGLYISITPDFDSDVIGYYCEVFKDESKKELIDEFFVHTRAKKESAKLRQLIREVVDKYDPPEKDPYEDSEQGDKEVSV